MRTWLRLSLFWRFQIVGWVVFLALTFPLKFVVLGGFHSSLIVSLYREGLGFLTTWGMREIYRRIYRERMGIGALCLLVVSVSLAGALVQASLCFAFHDVFDFEEDKIFKNAAVFAIIYFRVVLSLAWSLLYFGIKLFWEKTDRDRRLIQSAKERSDTELRLLRAIINSHFMFNALNTILHAVEQQRKGIAKMVQALSDYLNFSLRHKDDDFVALGEEVDALVNYLILEKARLGERLDISCRMNEETRNLQVPGIILQPLVENAIKYGSETCSPPVIVRVLVFLEDSELLIEVANTGRWIDPERERTSGGIGLENIRQRLTWLYGDRHHMEILSEENWVSVRILIPAIL